MMIILIAALCIFGTIMSMLDHSTEGELDMNLLFPIILIIDTWKEYFLVSVLTIIFVVIVLIARRITKAK